MAKTKIIQHFADVCSQMFLNSLSNSDRVNFVVFGSGSVRMDFLSQKCTHNGIAVSPFFYCIHFRNWLATECAKQGVDQDNIVRAELIVELTVKTERNDGGGISGWMSSTMSFDCTSRIATETKEYVSTMSDDQTMGLGQIIPGNEY